MTITQTTPLVPSFDDVQTDRKLAIICSKGTLDMAYPGLILANAALGEGIETHLFFTFWGFDMITKETMGNLKFTMLGNTATHMPQGLGGLPATSCLLLSLSPGPLDRLRGKPSRGGRVDLASGIVRAATCTGTITGRRGDPEL